ncbi:macrolide ABC transporter ATP-binding protein [Paenibacillus selenitireducens]|uniref:Macrolide ABC transporter ATP-binding protein n=1 Tax=Paenibacillus selenitireducens TaxID=1324314 RepID=A0A1T2XKA5_9BACL|nr:ABC transporter ATP-binding protein [Paenibacillus selenitireducens]OPA80299.1 macrolide ABC transporter ATP-binding protein [Paenibacillus selenitireducens]
MIEEAVQIQQHRKPLLILENIVKTYQMGGELVTTLHGVSLQIHQGEFVAIVGPSGSGKSTLMNMIGCLDLPTSGSYWIDGNEVNRMNDNKLAEIRNQKIGFIFQSFHLLSALSALENVELPLVYRGISAKERKAQAQQALREVGLEERIHHRPSQLSGGQQQRVAIARALAGQPPILLADEPTGALDTKTGHEVMQMIHTLHEKGHTIVLITHDPEIAKQAETVIHIVDGQISHTEVMQT